MLSIFIVIILPLIVFTLDLSDNKMSSKEEEETFPPSLHLSATVSTEKGNFLYLFYYCMGEMWFIHYLAS